MYKKNKIVVERNLEPQLNDRIKQLQNEAAAVSCEYKLDDYDIAELVFERYCDKFPDTHIVDIRITSFSVFGTFKSLHAMYEAAARIASIVLPLTSLLC